MKKYSASIRDFVESFEILDVVGDTDIKITSLHLDSREDCSHGLFAVIRGEHADGHDYIAAAISNGAIAVLCEKLPDDLHHGVTYLVVSNSKETLSLLASQFYQYPTNDLKVVAVTGTNGKTTIATTLYQALRDMGNKVGLVSTVENRINDQVLSTQQTTPDVITLQRLFAEMRDQGCEYVCMEFSSHALAYGREKGVHFTGAIFTNLSHEHLDFHKTMEHYAATKKRLFDVLTETAFAITNQDDEKGEYMVSDTKAKILKYSEALAFDVEYSIKETKFNLDQIDYTTPLVGKFNLYNTLAILLTLRELGVEGDELRNAIANLRPVRGRFEILEKEGVIGIVDYAHTPDALENVLKTIKDLKTHNSKLITVIGCGGDRDPSKRGPMASIAARYSDMIFLTSDNPRTEDPEKILDDMEAGLEIEWNSGRIGDNHVVREVDRAKAIRSAKEQTSAGDIILIAGKGHETYQEVNDKRSHFDDREEFLK